VVIIIVCILLAIVLLPPLISQGYGLIREVEVPGLDLHFENYSFTLTDISNIADRLSGSAATLFSIVNSTFSSILMFFTLIVLSMYMMLGRQKLYMKFYWITRNVDTIVTIRGLIDDIEEQLGGWVRGQLILMFVIGIANFIVLSLLGVPYALALALVAGALEILPNLGPTLAAVPSVVVAYVSGGPVLAIAVLVGVIIIQQVENNILVPKIMSDNANVNPLASIIIILIGLTLGGVVGALLCIPIYIIIRALYSTFVLSQHVQHDNLNVDKT
ncbi:AI-2E family transporter, partial [Candidatus Woesebacteria bacterium]|nr:AI-2E family transporter [Candidatus Woesebacteria bacterium]